MPIHPLFNLATVRAISFPFVACFGSSHFACPNTIILAFPNPDPISILPIKSAPPSALEGVTHPYL